MTRNSDPHIELNETEVELIAALADHSSPENASSPFDLPLTTRLRADFMHGEITIWNILIEAADEIERLRGIPAQQTRALIDAGSELYSAFCNRGQTNGQIEALKYYAEASNAFDWSTFTSPESQS